MHPATAHRGKDPLTGRRDDGKVHGCLRRQDPDAELIASAKTLWARIAGIALNAIRVEQWTTPIRVGDRAQRFYISAA